MKSLLRTPFMTSLLGRLIWAYMIICARTIRWTIEGDEEFRRAWVQDHGLIIAAWHSRILLIPTIWSKIARKLPKNEYPTAMLVSLSRDGEAVAKAVEYLGLQTVRGSSAHKRKRKDKGGVAAIAEASRRLRSGSVICITPDGPRGPAEEFQTGPVILAQRSNAAIIPYALDCTPIHRLKTWDRFMIPIPFSRGAMVIGEPVVIDRNHDNTATTALLATAMKEVHERARHLIGKPD